METIKIKISELKPSEYNPRKISEQELDKLVRSIKKFGFLEPIIVNKDNSIIGGHQRVKAANLIGMQEVPAIRIDLSENLAKALNLALNKISGEWDEDKLYDLLKDIQEREVDLLNFIGFDDEDVLKILNRNIKEDSEPEFDENIDVKNKCPKCGYEW